MKFWRIVGVAAKTCALLILFPVSLTFAQTAMTLSSPSGVSVQLDAVTGNYRISAEDPGWLFSGTLPSAASDVTKINGHDPIGAYQQMTFTWQNGQTPLEGTIRLYQQHPLLLFQYKYLKDASPASVSFPSFTTIPVRLHHFSYKNGAFAVPQFELGQYGTPWLFFDDNANAAVISPASHFIIATMHGDGDHLVASGLNDRLPGVPAGFAQQTLMVISPGIRHTFNIWGSGLIALGGKERPGNESDTTLRYYGYWTDNGAAYYYRYGPKMGYADTLKAVIQHYREEKIPVRYLQLDSWWYDKSSPDMSPNDHTGTWKASGGIMQFRADASLFPQGLEAFDRSVGGLPLVVHSRWISQQSPYRENYQISGVAPVGAKWWNDTAEYLESNGVVTYEQDWQNRITEQSPAFNNTIGTGDDFYNHMANSCQTRRLTMQYCMALPSDFLEGSRYGNLTSIRTSDDRFSRPRWRDFLYTSQLAYSIGSWPWTDVYFSHETNNILIGTLSAGPVGTGDALGAEDKKNIMMAVRGDGVIVKPDVPLMPLDRMYVEDATAPGRAQVEKPLDEMSQRGEMPFIASTWTDDGSIRTAYVFAFSRSTAVYQTVDFTPEEAGAGAAACVYDYFSHLVTRVARGEKFKAFVGPGETGYYIVAPIGPSGIALFGDKGKFASMGKERITSVTEGPHSITAQVIFAAGDGSVTLFGDAPSAPSIVVHDGSADAVSFRQTDGYFSVRITPDSNTPVVEDHGDPVRRLSIEIALPAG